MKYQKGGMFDNDIRHWDFAPSKEVFDEIFRVSKNQIIWGGNYFNLPPTRCFNVWKKLTISEKFSMAMCEYAWTSFNENAKIFEFAPQDKNRFHPTQKPVDLIAKQLNLYSKEGDLVLDCFSGSGTTAIACHRLKRRFICIEKDPEYWAASVKRLEEEQSQGVLF
jgi:site-specific DNA-methyltransferase (adenine-specific)